MTINNTRVAAHQTALEPNQTRAAFATAQFGTHIIKVNVIGSALGINTNIIADYDFDSFKTDAGAIAGSVIGGVALGTTIATFFVWFYTSHKSSHPVTQKSPQTSEVTILSSPSPPIAPTQSESQPVPQNPYDPDDIPTATTIPRVRTDSEATLMSKMFSTTEPFWGQVGQYYHGVPEV
ncbi:hypothetical protein F5887DRAFT_927032 [Amanita rubescens]|nr:hypothetical protein F5887DRAFT_927032 [Amanita rubescens]